MSTLDVVNQVGGKAANFLDIGGGANADVMAAALEVINFDQNVKSIFINIFGGITRGEEVAKGIVEALSRVELRAPIVIRLDGTNAEEGRQILADAGIPESEAASASPPCWRPPARPSPSRTERKLTWPSSSTPNTKVIVQGLTGGQGKYHGLRNKAYGTQVVGGVTPGKGGTGRRGRARVRHRRRGRRGHRRRRRRSSPCRPRPHRRRSSKPPRRASRFIVCITEGIPAQDEAKVFNTLAARPSRARACSARTARASSAPASATSASPPARSPPLPTAGGPERRHRQSRSGTLTYQALYELKQRGIGVSTCVGIGGDPVPGTSFIDCLAEFQADPETHAIIMIGEIGGSAEEEAAEFITANVTKPMSAYIAGVTAPAGKKMGHAGAIVSGGKGTAQGKMDALAAAGVQGRPEPHRSRRPDGRDRRRHVTTLVKMCV